MHLSDKQTQLGSDEHKITTFKYGVNFVINI